MGIVTHGNIILIRPPIDITFSQANPPIGLGYLASVLEAEGYHVTILDLAIWNISDETIINFILKKAPLFVGISALTTYYMAMKRIAKLIKDRCPSVPLILGGIHVSSVPELTIEECKLDFIVIGEGEKTIVELASFLQQGRTDYSSIKGIAFKEGCQSVFTEPRKLIEDLDSLPFPAWHKINPRKYPAIPHGFLMKYYPVAPILSTRGCPYSCSYCASCQFWQSRIRYRSPKNVVDEIQFLYERYKIREFHFWDDNLTLKRIHITAICKEILRRGLDIALATPNGIRIDTLDEHLLKLMRRAGFYHLTFPVESGSTMVLKANKKKTQLSKIVRNTLLAKKLGFSLNAYFLIGFQQDTIETIRKTIDFSRVLPFDMRGFFVVRPLPGSEIFQEWSLNRDLHNFDWNGINFYNADEVLADIDPETVVNLVQRAYKETILRFPFIIWLFYFRFIKYGHVQQYKFLIARVIHMLSGLNFSANRLGLKLQ